jgi:hypothetical protein
MLEGKWTLIRKLAFGSRLRIPFARFALGEPMAWFSTVEFPRHRFATPAFVTFRTSRHAVILGCLVLGISLWRERRNSA